MFNLSITDDGGVTCITPEGRLDTLNYESFNESLKVLLENEEYLIIDFTKCSYLSSSGIRALLTAAKKLSANGGYLIISGLSAEVFQVLEMAGLDTVFRICKDKESALEDILRVKTNFGKVVEFRTGEFFFQTEYEWDNCNNALHWHNKDLAGYNELVLATGTGSPAECLAEDEENSGQFVTIGNCSGFFPFAGEQSHEFRVLKDPALGGVFINKAISCDGDPSGKIKLISPQEIELDKLLDILPDMPRQKDGEMLRALLIADYNNSAPSISLVFFPDYSSPDFPETSGGKKIIGARFLLNEMDESEIGESFLSFANRTLKIQNIESAGLIDLSAKLKSPIAWLFYSEEWTDAESHRIKVETFENFYFEPYKIYLTRKLYTDSARVIIKPIHGGFSAETFQVDSYDKQGRKLRPTVLKIANRKMILREAERCMQYSLPYIMNNSAMVLGTAYFCETGALRYNFVGIDGEQTQLKWLTHYFTTWQSEELEPLFDKIFLQILKPWYGQPVREKIFPYRDQNPTSTFFPRLCETAEELLSISADEKHIKLEAGGQMQMNPYWFLKHEYKKRLDYSIDYFTSICHGDLNMQNILLDKEMNVYLIDFSETQPRSVVSDFARLEAIFMIEHAPLNSEKELKNMFEFTSQFYNAVRLDHLPKTKWHGAAPDIMKRNLALILKMREYAIGCTSGDYNIVPYYLALLEWILPVICYGSANLIQKKLSAHIAGILCEKIMECDN